MRNVFFWPVRPESVSFSNFWAISFGIKHIRGKVDLKTVWIFFFPNKSNVTLHGQVKCCWRLLHPTNVWKTRANRMSWCEAGKSERKKRGFDFLAGSPLNISYLPLMNFLFCFLEALIVISVLLLWVRLLIPKIFVKFLKFKKHLTNRKNIMAIVLH